MDARLDAARRLLKSSLLESAHVSSALNDSAVRLREIGRTLPGLEAQIRHLVAHESTRDAVRSQVECVVGPVAALVRVNDAVCELERSLLVSDPHADLFAYVSVVQRLEEALRFLSSNCELLIRWGEEILSLVANDGCFLGLKQSLGCLERLRDMERRSRFEGGPICSALDELEDEFRSLITENADMTTMLIQKLHAVIQRLQANDRLENCVSFFVRVRVSNARIRLGALDLKYLDVQVTEYEDMEFIESYVERWGKHLDMAVKSVFGPEHKLCKKVFENIDSGEVWINTFAKIAIESGILSFLRFGKKITKMKKDPIKLLRLLEIFKALNGLRLEFSWIFGSEACSVIQSTTRDLVKNIVEKVCLIFRELPEQVALQRQLSSPPDGGVPRLVSFVTELSNRLLSDSYMAALTEVLTIDRKWNNEAFSEKNLVSDHIRAIMNEIGLNLDEWSKAYADTSHSRLFMMNSHGHFCSLKGTRLGDVMGEAWLSAHEHYRDLYAASYLKESWGEMLPLLNRKGLVSVSSLNEAIDERLEKHSKWVISDEMLRRDVCRLLVQTVVPHYRNYVKRCEAPVEDETAQRLEKKLSSMFCSKARVKKVVANRFRVTLTAL